MPSASSIRTCYPRRPEFGSRIRRVLACHLTNEGGEAESGFS
jgi:hypothetical protein